MALIKHIAIKNVSYSDALAYLKFEHDEFKSTSVTLIAVVLATTVVEVLAAAG